MRFTAKRYGIHSLNLIYSDGLNSHGIFLAKEKDDIRKISFSNKELQKDLWNLPLAIYSSRLNPRIRSQSGNFMAYSLFTRPICLLDEQNNVEIAPEEKWIVKPDRFSYISLQKIQEFYLANFPKEKPFMLELRVPASEKEAIGIYLRKAGINKYRFYPELENLKLDI